MGFIGRTSEIQALTDLEKRGEASLLVIYGRRRVGKTTLIEQAFGSRNLVKFEGVQGKDDSYQLNNFVETIKSTFSNPLLRTAQPQNWKQAFELLANLVSTGKWTIYLEELQWLAEYKPDLIAELKPVWDNQLRRNPELILVLCGSAPSFFISHVIRSQALYNRTTLNMRLDEFSLAEGREFLPKYSKRGYLDAYLTVGGIPPYLEQLRSGSSVYLSLCAGSFRKNSFFRGEFDKVFVSSFGNNPVYRAIVEIVSRKQRVTRGDLLKELDKTSGGTVSKLLLDLEESGFIRKIHPLDKKQNSRLACYQIDDPYLRFYYQFIAPQTAAIDNGDFDQNPALALDTRTYSQWLGFAFERQCRRMIPKIAAHLGFSAVKFRAGVMYRRANLSDPGMQIDLLFDRADKVKSVCEIKYTEAAVGTEVIAEVEKKIGALKLRPSSSIQRVLISAAGITQALEERHYFDRVIGLEDLLP